MPKAICLLSGGLDSALSAKIVKEQGVKLLGLVFESIFFRIKHAYIIAKYLNIPLKVVNIDNELLEILKAPKYGFGKNMNPCVDCHICMLNIAKNLMDELGYDFVVTGEVLGERRKSQTLQALQIIEKEAGLEGRLLRPLSAKLLKPTIAEEQKLIDRNKLYDFSGKSRKKQLSLAKEFKLEGYYATPAGGCKLTEPNFAKRLKDLFLHSDPQIDDIELLKLGRHFRLSKYSKLIISRTQEESLKLTKLKKITDVTLSVKNYPGSLGLIRGEVDNTILLNAASLVARYSKGRFNENVWVNINIKGDTKQLLVRPREAGEIGVIFII